MSMDRALELLEYYGKHPPAHVVLGLVYLKQQPAAWKPLSESESLAQMRQLAGELNQGTEKLPPHLREMANWAVSQSAKI